jgi:DNA-binding beta-propeller fold protein YncE
LNHRLVLLRIGGISLDTKQRKNLSGENMKKWFVVGLLASSILVLLIMRNTKAGIAAAQESASQSPTRELAPLQLVQKIPVPNVAGRIDHFTAFPKRRLLIFAALGNNSMEIVNTFQAKVVQSIKGLNEPQGVLYVPGLDKIFVANAGNGVVKVYDGKTYALRKSIEFGEEADTDNLRYDEDSKRVFVGVVGGIGVIDAVSETRVGKDLKGSGGHSESFQVEKKGSRIFVNVPEDGSVVNVIDRKTGELTKWGLNGVKANYPMALDEENHRLFVVTRRPPFVMVLDTNSGKEIARIPIGGSCDDVYYDGERKRIYAIAGEGFISVIQQNGPDHYTLSANIPSAIGVRTGIFYGTSLYVGVPAGGLEPAQIWNYQVPE